MSHATESSWGKSLGENILNEDGSTFLRWENGIQCEDLASDLRKIRIIQDVLDNSVRQFFGKDPEVTAWVKDLGGLRAVQEKLIGLKLSPKSWFMRTRKRLREEMGVDIPPLGDPVPVEGVESATSYSGFSVDVHRTIANRRAHGELYEEEDNTSPDWDLIETDLSRSQFCPTWWGKIKLGMFRPYRTKSQDLKQVEICKDPAKHRWMPDIRLSDQPFGFPYKVAGQVMSWSVVQDRPGVKKFIDRFYNEPMMMLWQKVGPEGGQRWACAMQLPSGQWLWAPVSQKSSQYMDWRKSNKAGSYQPKGTRALYMGKWVITYRKAGENIHYTKLKQSEQTGLWEVWSTKEVHWKDWWNLKKQALAMGAKDAYFGRPWKLYEKS